MSPGSDKALLAIREAAADWVVRLASVEVSPNDKAFFAAWLRASPIHVKEYLRAEATWFAMATVTQADSSDISELLRRPDSNIIELSADVQRFTAGDEAALPVSVIDGESIAGRMPVWRRAIVNGATHRRPVFVATAAVALLLLGATLAIVFSGKLDPNTYSTDVGEMRRVVLADGSAMELNTHSKIRVDIRETSRDVYLTQGEAFFSVAKDPKRPFRVMSDSTAVRAIGTQFSVFRQAGQTVVTVVEGAVAVSQQHLRSSDAALSPRSASALDGTTLELKAGQRIVVSVRSGRNAVASPILNVDAARATSWRQRRLVFQNESLATVVAEFNRYNRRQLVVHDTELAAQGISGVFDPDKPEGLTRFLVSNGDVQAVQVSDSLVLLARPE